MEADARKWLQKKVETFLRRVGLTEGQTVLDFGCNEGNYTIPAARIVGEGGKVYALDKNKDSLEKLIREVEKKRLRNIKPLYVQEAQKLPLRSCCVDAVLLYDTLHGGYFPEPAQRSTVLQRIHRVLKPQGLLSYYPTHLKQYGLTFRQLDREIRSAGFRLEAKACRKLVHDGNLVRGRIFGYRKVRSRNRRQKNDTFHV